MNSVFDYFLKQEMPTIILCNPNRIPIASLKASFNVANTLRFNAISELEFDYPQSVDNWLTINSAYSMIKVKMIVFVKDVGYFVITECPEDSSGGVPVKHVSCQSIDIMLNNRRLTGFTLTSVKLYDYVNPEGTVLNLVLKYYPGWSVGYIDPDLLISPTTGKEVRRQFEIDNNTLYNFLIAKAGLAFNCVFDFDTINKTVSAYSIPNLNENIGLYFSFNNVNSEITVTEYSDEISTCLYVFGKDDLDITRVNPLGTNAIYNFDYFKTTEWMNQDMIDSLSAWENKITELQDGYADKANQLYEDTLDLAQLESDLIENQAELEGLQQEYAAYIAGKMNTSSLINDIKEKYLDVSNLKEKIGEKKEEIASLQADLKRVNAQLRFTRKGNILRFSTDLNSIYTSIKQASATWKTIFNIKSVDPVLVESNIQLDYDTPLIEGAFNNALASLEKLINFAKYLQNIYPSINDEDLSAVNETINETKVYLETIYTIFDGYIPKTDIAITVSTSNILLNSYVDILGYESNLTEDQYLLLQDFIYENTYTNKNIGLNDAETIEFNEGQVQSLYDGAVSVLQRISKPRFEVEGNFVNILALPEYSNFIEKLDLGKIVTIEIGEGKTVEAALLEMVITYDDPTSFEMTFSNRVRLNNSNFQFVDMFSDSVEKASGVSIS